jgi:hypothetical protein
MLPVGTGTHAVIVKLLYAGVLHAQLELQVEVTANCGPVVQSSNLNGRASLDLCIRERTRNLNNVLLRTST